jgi:hypothetical protein
MAREGFGRSVSSTLPVVFSTVRGSGWLRLKPRKHPLLSVLALSLRRPLPRTVLNTTDRGCSFTDLITQERDRR